MAEKVWFITGASRGFGRIWAEAALKRGDKVVATARTLADVADLRNTYGDRALPLSLDVTHAEQVKAVVQQAHAHFGRLDVILNNAGYSLVATVEEAREADVQALFGTNYFGTLRVIQAALPLLRKQGHGHIVGVSSGLGLVTIPLIGFYCTSKWAFEALHESLAAEVKQFGISVTILEPGAYATEFGSATSRKTSPGIEAYAPLRKQVHERISGIERGEPEATADAVLKVIDATEPPLRIILGNSILPMVKATYAARIKGWEEWETISNSAQGVSRKQTTESF